jgi:hypothetical protein
MTMTSAIVLGLLGWVGAVVFGVTLVLPLGVKALSIRGAAQWAIMRAHAPLGLCIPLLATAHACIAMPSGQSGQISNASLGLGTAALILMVVQCCLGLALWREAIKAPHLRRLHLTLMLVILVLLGLHISLY